jgi:hypothetical protein
MFKKMCFLAGVLILAGVAAALTLNTSLSFADNCQATDEVTIQSKLWKTDKYGPVKLTHKKHAEDYKIPCQDCHHVYKDGKNVWKQGEKVQKCDECHTCVKTGKALKDATPDEKKLSLYNAFHDNCKGCHKKHNTETQTKDAPTKCTDCHEKLDKK